MVSEHDLELAYDEHGGELLGFAHRALSDRHLAEDAVQETFVRAWRARHRFDPERGSLRTWLFAIARNCIRDAIRRRPTSETPPLNDTPEAWEPPMSDPVDQLLDRIYLAEAMGHLTPEHRQILVEVYYGGRTCAELATEMDVSASTLRSRLFYGVRSLRLALEENGGLAR